MPTIPNPIWDEQTSTPFGTVGYNEKDQLMGCMGCALEETPAPTPPPGTIFMFRGSSFCITHLIEEKANVRRFGNHNDRTLT